MIPRLFRGLRLSTRCFANANLVRSSTAGLFSVFSAPVRAFSSDIPEQAVYGEYASPRLSRLASGMDKYLQNEDYVGAWKQYCSLSNGNSVLASDVKALLETVVRVIPLDVLLEEYESHILASPEKSSGCIQSILTAMRLQSIPISQNLLSCLVDSYLAEGLFQKALRTVEASPQEYGMEVSYIPIYSLIHYLGKCVQPKNKRGSFAVTYTIPKDVPKHTNWNPVHTAISIARNFESSLPQRHQCKIWSLIIESCFEAELTGLASQLMDECVDKNMSLGTPVLQALVKHTVDAGDVLIAKKIFNYSFSTHSPPTMVTINALIRGFLEMDDLPEAIRFLEKIIKDGMATLDQSTIKLFIQYFVNMGDFDGQRLLLNILSQNQIPIDYGVVNLIFSSLSNSFDPVRVRMLLDSILELGYVPPVITYTNAIRSLCHMGAIDIAKKIYLEMGALGIEPNVVTYTTLIQALAEHGRFFEAWGMKNDMIAKGIQPNALTYKVLLRRSSFAVELSYYLKTILEMIQHKMHVDQFFIKHCAKLLLFQKKHDMLQQLADAIGQPVETLTKHAVMIDQDKVASSDWVNLDISGIESSTGYNATEDASTVDGVEEPMFEEDARAKKLNRTGLKLAQAKYKRAKRL